MSVTTIVVATLAFVVALASLLLSFVQFSTRTRPFLSVSRLTSSRNQDLNQFFVKIDVKNVGEVPAKNVVLSADFDPSDSIVTGTEHSPRNLGAIFPNETVFRELPMGNEFSSFMGGQGGIYGLGVTVEITYESPFSVKLWGFSFGHHRTHQSLYLDANDGWGRTRRTQMA